MTKRILLITIFLSCLQISYTQPGTLDLSFGGKGWIIEDFIKTNVTNESVTKIFTEKNGGNVILIGGGANALMRLLTDGSIDKSFGDGGYVFLKFGITTAEQQSDGKILVGGETDLIRYNANGSLDKTFGETGKQISSFRIASIALEDDGKIVVSGPDGFRIARFNSNGSPDVTFDSDGVLLYDGFDNEEIYLQSLEVQNDSKIVVAGITVIILHLYCDGIPCFERRYQNVLIRYNADGTLDQSFGHEGLIREPSVNEWRTILVALQNDGKIILSKSINDGSKFGIGLTRYNNDGKRDITFNDKSFLFGFVRSIFVSCITLQSDGKVIVTATMEGESDFIIARYNNDGNFDNSFDADGKVTTDFGFSDLAVSVVVQPDGTILAGGSILKQRGDDFALASYNSDGSLNDDFSGDGKQAGYVPVSGVGYLSSIAVGEDSKIIAAGNVFDSLSRYNFFVSKYNLDGIIDSSFGNDGKQITGFGDFNSIPSPLAVQKDGKIVLAGAALNGSVGDYEVLIVRYNSNGSLDSTFSEDGKETTNFGTDGIFLSSVWVQKDGKIVLAGGIWDGLFGSYTLLVVRYNSNGSLDKTFSGDGIQISDFEHAVSLTIQSDGKILVVGDATLSRFNTDGSPDLTFSEDGTQTISTISYGRLVVVQNDGKILVGGGIVNGKEGLAIGRFNSDGSIDETFNKTGVFLASVGVYSYAYDIDVQTDGKIIITGGTTDSNLRGDLLLIRLNVNGSYDESFASNGQVIKDFGSESDYGYAAAIKNNKLYVTGNKIISAYRLEASTNTPPTVTITSPINDITYIGPANITITANASDEDGTISKVEFYHGTTLLRTERYIGYSWTWKDVPIGDYAINAKAYDNDGNVTISSPVHISVVFDEPPVVTLTSPVDDSVYKAGRSIILSADASDADGTIKKVEFYSGTTLIGTEQNPPYFRKWYNAPLGDHYITAKATDNLGAVTVSAPVHIAVVNNQPPIVIITSPLNGANYTAPSTVIISADASDADGTIKKVEFYSGTTLLRTERYLGYEWYWKDLPAGNYTIIAKATDDNGRTTESAPVMISVAAADQPIVSNRSSLSNGKSNINSTLTLTVAPNPAKNILNIYTTGLQKDKQLILSIISSSGVVIKTFRSTSSTQTIQLNVASLVSEVYTIKMISGGKVIYKKFVKL